MSFFRVITTLLSILTHHDKKFLALIAILSVLISAVEMAGVTAILPFISIATNFDTIHTNSYLDTVYNFFAFRSEIDFVITAGIVLLVFYLVRSALNLGYFYLLAKFSRGRYHLIAYRLFENYIGMSYRRFIEKNSADLTKTIITEAQNLTSLISGLMLMISEIFVVVFIYAFMLYINWKITLLITLILVANGVLLNMTVSKAIKKAGKNRETHQKDFYTIINNTLGNFKMLKLTSKTDSILKAFEDASSGYARANIKNETLVHFPRLFLEALGFGIVIFIVIYLVYKYQNDISSALALISMFIVGLYRLMPSANRILTGYNQMIFMQQALRIIHNDLMYDAEDLGHHPVVFQETLRLENLSFGYHEHKMIFQNLNLTVHKGDKIAIIGESGSGKSTLIDLIIGLYRPKEGAIRIDGVFLDQTNVKNWRSKIGYIPQSITLFDGTIAENVAFGREIIESEIRYVLQQANILDFLEMHHKGIDSHVGENGIKLSGGQRQRIAIARALYKNPEVLVLDEATSALDNETEAKIMEEIYRISENKTLIVIAHRLSTIQKCEKVYRLQAGQITRIENH